MGTYSKMRSDPVACARGFAEIVPRLLIPGRTFVTRAPLPYASIRTW